MAKFEFPYQIVDLEPQLNAELMSKFEGERTGFCQVGPKRWLLPEAYKRHAEGLYNAAIREDDVWIITFPRSGTTWCQELVWLLNNNLDFKSSSQVSLDTRFPFYEFTILHHEKFHEDVLAANDNDPEVDKILRAWRVPGYDFLPKMSSPRHIKTHLPFSLLPPNLTKVGKAIYVARNPKDVAASYFHHNSLLRLQGYVGNFKQYWDYFEKDLLVYSPYFEHVKEGWERRNDPNVLFLFYEELILDLPSNIRKVASFLGKPISSDEVDKLTSHLHIDNFKKSVKVHDEIPMNGMVRSDFASGFFRKGGIGGNKEYDDELSKKADEYAQRHLVGTDLKFPQKNGSD